MQMQLENNTNYIKGTNERRRAAEEQVKQWEPASTPREVKVGWFGKLGEDSAAKWLECRVRQVISDDSMIVS